MIISAAKEVSEKGRKILEKEFDRYSQMLLQHLQSKLGSAPGAVKFAHIVSIIEAMAHFSQKHKQHHILMLLLHNFKKPELLVLEEVMN